MWRCPKDASHVRKVSHEVNPNDHEMVPKPLTKYSTSLVNSKQNLRYLNLALS